jgi:hypothetical protein
MASSSSPLFIEPICAVKDAVARGELSDARLDSYRRLQEAPSLTVPMIHAYRVAGRQGDADRLAAQCSLRWPSLKQVCADEAAGRAVVKQ